MPETFEDDTRHWQVEQSFDVKDYKDFIFFINLLEIGQSFLTFVLYDIYILRERTLKTNSFLSLENVKDKPPPYRQERRQGGGFAMHKLIIR